MLQKYAADAQSYLSTERRSCFFILAFAFIQIFIGLSYEEFDGYGYLMVKAFILREKDKKGRERWGEKKEWVKREKKLKGKEVEGKEETRREERTENTKGDKKRREKGKET